MNKPAQRTLSLYNLIEKRVSLAVFASVGIGLAMLPIESISLLSTTAAATGSSNVNSASISNQSKFWTAQADLSEPTQRPPKSGIVLAVLSGLVLAGLGGAGFVLIRTTRHSRQQWLRQRDQAITALACQAELLRTTLASIGDAVITTDSSGRVETMNAIAQLLTGWTSEAAKGQMLEDIFNIVNEDTRQPVSNPATRALAQGTIVGPANHTVLIAKDGTETPIDDSAAPIRIDGQTVGYVLVFRDIAERRQQDNRLQYEQERLSLALKSAELGQWDMNMTTNEANRNLRHDQIFGYESFLPHWTYEIFLEHVFPEDRPVVDAAFQQATEDGSTWDFECRITRADGEERWIAAKGKLQKRTWRLGDRMFGIVTDITDRKQAEAQIAASERQFRAIADTIPQMVWVADAEGTPDYYNQRWCDYVGCAASDFMGEDWSAPIHPDDRQQTINRWAEAVASGKPHEVEYRLSNGEGYRWFLVRALPLRADSGQILKWFGTCTDIEDFKQIQKDRQRFVRLAENSGDFIGMSDVEDVPLYVNPAGMKMVGLDSLAEAQSVSVADYFFPEDRNTIINEFLPAAREKGHGEIEIRFRHFKTEEPIWMVHKVFALSDGSGQTSAFATISQNITERRQMELNLRQLAADLSEADRRKDDFLATLAHELRNPLAPIRNGLQIMRRSNVDSETFNRLRDMMNRQMTQMVHLIDDLLDVSRISRGKIDLRLERTDLALAIQAAIEATQAAVEAAQHELIVTHWTRPIYINADSVRLTQVFSNLLNNASKYSEPGGTISLTVKQISENGKDIAVVSIKDKGIGISAEMLPKIFNLFSQVEGSLSKSQGGLGIGLTLVRQLVEMHGGTVNVKSEGLNKGSEFIVRLPAPSESVEPTTTESPSPALETTGTSARRILIVDDNEDSALTLSMLFEIMGDETRTVYDGRTAVQTAETFRPDIALLDIGLPELNGYEAAQQIRQSTWGKDIILVALTGWSQEEDRQKSSAAGFNAHMVKPIDHDELQQLLDELMGQRR